MTYPTPYRPNAGTFNRSLAEGLAREHDVKVVAPLPWQQAAGAMLRGLGRPPARGLSCHGIEVLHPIFFYPIGVFRNWHGGFLWYSIRRVLRSLFAGFAPDVVIGYWAYPDGYAAVRAAREAGAAALLVIGGSDVFLVARKPSRVAAIREALMSADAVLAVGQSVRDRVVELGVPPSRVHVYRRGVDGAIFHPGDRGAARRQLGLAADVRVLLWVGRMVPVKGLDVLINACVRLRERGNKFELYLIGNGPLAAQLATWIADAECESVVHLVGAVEQGQLATWYRAADLTVLASHSEGVPNVLLESSACGTPFVATRVGGVTEIATNPADLVPAGDHEALASAIERKLSMSHLRTDSSASPLSLAESTAFVVDLVRSLRESAVYSR